MSLPALPGLFCKTPRRVRIVEVGPRDGLQNEKSIVPTATKIALVDALTAAGHQHIEVSSFVSPKAVPQLADSAQVFAGITRREGVTYTALVPNEVGLQRALAAQVRSIAIFTAASETFNRKNIGCSIAESFERFRPVLALAGREGLRVRGYVSTAFVCPHEGPIATASTLDIVLRLRDAGVTNISLGDTTGGAFPTQVSRLLEAIEPRLGLDGLALHCHDTHHRALANILVGLLHGIEEYDSSVAGLGGCPFAPGATGNVATEELVSFLDGLGIATDIDLDKQRAAARILRPGPGL